VKGASFAPRLDIKPMQKYKSFILPFAIVVGLLFHGYAAFLKPIVPYLIFSMLLFSFSSINIKNLKVSFLDIWLLLFQLPAAASFR